MKFVDIFDCHLCLHIVLHKLAVEANQNRINNLFVPLGVYQLHLHSKSVLTVFDRVDSNQCQTLVSGIEKEFSDRKETAKEKRELVRKSISSRQSPVGIYNLLVL